MCLFEKDFEQERTEETEGLAIVTLFPPLPPVQYLVAATAALSNPYCGRWE
jgi:hypothetical protein